MDSRKKQELAQFLRSRRERINPAQVGLPAGRSRRTPGLRREEVAVLAGVSPTWYTYLEQGRDVNPSGEVLDNLAVVLKLSEDERSYLHLIATGHPPPDQPLEPILDSDARLQQVISSFSGHQYPVYVGNLYGDVLAWNNVAAEWYTDFGSVPPERRNMLWWLLTDPEARRRIGHWEADTRDVIARFRIASASRPWDRRFEEMTVALGKASADFRRWWADHDVSFQHTRSRFIHTPDGTSQQVELVVLRMTDSFHSVVLHIPPTIS